MTCAVAIVVVTYNSREFLRELFASLFAHTDFADVKLIVVDNASTDGTCELLRELAANYAAMPFELLPQTHNSGFTGGCNAGIARARQLEARYVQLLNPDTVVAPRWLSRVREVMDARPEIGAAQPLLLLHGEPDLVNSAGNAIHFCGFGYCDGYRQPRAHFDHVRSVPYATGAALLLRTSALDIVGDFDDTLFLYHEDCDLQIRLRLAGYDCVLVPDVAVFHKYRADFSPRKYGWLERNRWLVLVKDWPLAELIGAAPALFFVEAAVVLFALRNGFAREKIWAYRELFANLPRMLAARPQVQALRRKKTRLAPHLTGAMSLPGNSGGLIDRVVNPLLSGYWRLVTSALDRHSVNSPSTSSREKPFAESSAGRFA